MWMGDGVERQPGARPHSILNTFYSSNDSGSIEDVAVTADGGVYAVRSITARFVGQVLNRSTIQATSSTSPTYNYYLFVEGAPASTGSMAPSRIVATPEGNLLVFDRICRRIVRINLPAKTVSQNG